MLRVTGREVVVAVTNGRLDGFALLTRTFGTWERIFQARQNGWPVSLDGRHRKRVLVKSRRHAVLPKYPESTYEAGNFPGMPGRR